MKATLSLTLLFIFLTSCTSFNYLESSKSKNSLKSQKAPYVLLISIDGFRWDYIKKYSPRFLSKFRKKSTFAKSLRPSFPTKTFPNHLSIVTGERPMNHGIIANSFFAPDLNKSYALNNRAAIENGDFYTTTPLWVLAEKQEMVTATYFWPASEAEIQGTRPHYYLKYKHNTPHSERIKTVSHWLRQPKETRPHFLTLYFHDVDSAGHRYGPDSDEVKAAINKIDKSIETLYMDLEKLKLPLNIVIVSDHGMASLKKKNLIKLDSDPMKNKVIKNYKIIGHGPLIHFYAKTKTRISSDLRVLNKKAKHYKCFTNKNTPKKFNFRNNKRIGDIVCLAKRHWSIAIGTSNISKGSHGWSQYDGRDMHGIFMAQGPAFKENKEIKTFDNIHIYPMLSHLLGLEIGHNIDGKLHVLREIL